MKVHNDVQTLTFPAFINMGECAQLCIIWCYLCLRHTVWETSLVKVWVMSFWELWGFLDSPYLGLFCCLLLDQQLPCTEVTWCESTSIVLFYKIIFLLGGSWVWSLHPHACFGGLFQPQSLNLSCCTLLHLDQWRRHCNENTQVWICIACVALLFDLSRKLPSAALSHLSCWWPW